jgi:hypothetical protein
LNQSTDACAVPKGFASASKRTLIWIIDALGNEVLGNLGRGFLCSFDTTFGSGPAQAVNDCARGGLTENADKLDRQEFKGPDWGTKQRGGGAFFFGSARCASTLRRFTRTSANGQGRGSKLPAGDKRCETECTEGAEGLTEGASDSSFHAHISLRLVAIGNATDALAHRGFILFRQGGGTAEKGRLEHADSTASDALGDFPEVVGNALAFSRFYGSAEHCGVFLLEARFTLA